MEDRPDIREHATVQRGATGSDIVVAGAGIVVATTMITAGTNLESLGARTVIEASLIWGVSKVLDKVISRQDHP